MIVERVGARAAGALLSDLNPAKGRTSIEPARGSRLRAKLRPEHQHPDPRRRELGTLAADLPAGPLWRFDHGNELLVDVSPGTLTSVTDTELFAGANALAVESTPGIWEIIQFGNAELVAAGQRTNSAERAGKALNSPPAITFENNKKILG